MGKTKQLLQDFNIYGEIFEHPLVNGTRSANVAEVLGYPEDHFLKYIVLKSKNRHYISALILAPDRFDTKRLEELSGLKKLLFASKKDLKKIKYRKRPKKN